MECDGIDNIDANPVLESSAAINPLILDYYKKFGRKRDLEQFFSLSTAETEVRDVTSLFWRRMKSEDSSDSIERRIESSTELCRVSIKCSLPEQSSSQDETTRTKSDSESPPIITEDQKSIHSDEESLNDDNQSQKSMDAILDTSINKPLSPSSSINSQRKLEWDSLADVGYALESDRKTSASSLSTLERLALKQQYTNNDSKSAIDIGLPTAHSTMVDVTDNKNKQKKVPVKKTTKVYQKDIDVVKVTMPHGGHTNTSQAINVNLTKHISFNMDKDGSVKVEHQSKDLNLTPEMKTTDTEEKFSDKILFQKFDKEIQTSLVKTTEKSVSSDIKAEQIQNQKVPVLISLNTLRKRYKKKKIRGVRRKLKNKKKIEDDKENVPVQEKSTEQVSAAESFEYLPGHVYNQNKLHFKQPREQSRSINNTDNKSSLESSGAPTTESSKGSKHSFTKDLEKSIEVLKVALNKKHNDSDLKNKLIKELVQRLLKSRYRDDESTTDFLSGLSFNSKKMGLGESRVTTSTSDSNNTDTIPKNSRPKKSILRLDKFNSKNLASTSQSVPNLHSALNNDKAVLPKVLKPTSNTETDASSGKHSLDAAFAKTSSEELYHKYLEALKREEAYKKHLKDKEMFLKQKLVGSEPVKVMSLPLVDNKIKNKLEELIHDLTRNNYDDGSGDASKIERGSSLNLNFNRYSTLPKQRSHSVFTLSSGNSDEHRKANLKKRMQNDLKELKAGSSSVEGRCICHHQCGLPKLGVVDSSVQVNLKHVCQDSPSNSVKAVGQISSGCSRRCSHDSPRNIAHVLADDVSGDIKYVCLCNEKMTSAEDLADKMLIFKCSRLTTKEIPFEDCAGSKTSNTIGVQCTGTSTCCTSTDHSQPSTSSEEKQPVVNSDAKSQEGRSLSKSSQTKFALRTGDRKWFGDSTTFSNGKGNQPVKSNFDKNAPKSPNKKIVQEATRCIQTDISIDPKISDPSLCDINMVNNNNSVEFLNENSNDSSKSNVIKEENPNNISLEYIDHYASYKNQKNSVATASTSCRPPVLEHNSNRIQSEEIPKINDLITDNFTIPIQGTNMTLMVKIGSKTNSVPDKVNTDTAAETDQIEINEKATSLREECSRGVQSKITDTFDSKPVQSLQINETLENPKENINIQRKENLPLLNTCAAVKNKPGDSKCNTYPKAIPTFPKPILRTNTDTGRFFSCNCVQTDFIDNNKGVTQQTTRKTCQSERQSNRSKSSDSHGRNKTSSEKSDCDDLKTNSSTDTQCSKSSSECCKDPLLDLIKDIKRRYSKNDIEKSKKKKCFKEIMTVLNYLLDTEEGTDPIKNSKNSCSLGTDCDKSVKIRRSGDVKKVPGIPKEKKNISSCATSSRTIRDRSISPSSKTENSSCGCGKKKSKNNEVKKSKSVKGCCTEDKGVQSSPKMTKRCRTDSSEVQATTDLPETSTDSATCKVLNKIKRECEKYHQKKCKAHTGRRCDVSSSTSVNCERCKRVHHCHCRGHRCYKSKTSDNLKKKCVAYNLFIQTSDSMISEETMHCNKPLPNVVVRVPSKCKRMDKAPFREVYTKIEKAMPYSCSPQSAKVHRSKSLPNESEVSSADDRDRCCTVKDYLEINRPDFVKKSSARQQCVREICERRIDENLYYPRPTKMVIMHGPACSSFGPSEINCGGFPITCHGNQDNCEQYINYVQGHETGFGPNNATYKDSCCQHNWTSGH